MRRIFTAVCMVIILAVQTAFSLTAGAVGGHDEVIAAAFEYNVSSRGAADFWEELKFGGSDWTAVCYAKLYGGSGAEEYVADVSASAAELMASDGFVKPTDLQRAAVVMSALGGCSRELIDAAAYNNPDFDRQGFNAWIWALIAANCSGLDAGEGALHTRESLAEYILSKQLPDGGFTLFGESADCDITAAAIYALAPLSDNAEVSAALERAVARLSELQLESGGFSTMGIENCESASQAVIAFAAAGIDESDERVSSAVSAILQYRRDDGGFSHLPDGDTNGLASMQALEAFTSLELLARGERLFDASETEYAEQNETDSAASETLPATWDCAESEGQNAPSVNGTPDEAVGELPAADNAASETEIADMESSEDLTGFQIKLIISAALAAIAVILFIAFAAKRKKAFIALGAVCAAAAGAVWLLDIRTPEEYYAQDGGSDITVTFSADCGAALRQLDSIDEGVNPLSVIPEDGVVIELCEVGLDEGATAFDALISAAREQRVRVDYTGTMYGVYVSGIGYIYEFGFGEMSGWMYRVNGVFPDVSSGVYELSDGDIVEFVYTCDIGRDLE